MADLARVLVTHESDCSPLAPCAHCNLAEFLRKKLRPEVLGRLRALLAEASRSVEFREHSGACSPWHPCVACQGAALIRENLVPVIMKELEEKLRTLDNPVEPTVPTSNPETNNEHVARKLAMPWKEALPELSKRTYNCLENERYVSLGDIVRQTEAEILRVPNFGRRSLNELKELLAGQGLHFGWNG